jgi:HEAT repeat protein
MRAHLLSGLGLSLVLLLPRAGGTAERDADEAVLRGAGVATDGPGLLEFFRKRTLEEGAQKRMHRLIEQLGDEEFTVREQASRELVALGARARPLLQEAAASSDPEVRRRAQACLRKIGDKEGNNVEVVAAAARLLAARKPAGCAGVLLAYVPAAEMDGVADVVRDALVPLAVQDGKPDPTLVAGLGDRQPACRGAAAEALCRAGVRESLPALRKLLEDPDRGVRLRAALGLVSLREKDAVEPLIALLDHLPLSQTEPVELFLERLAADHVPSLPEQKDEEARRKYRQTWQKWWKENQERVTAARVGEAAGLRGLTLVVLLEKGEIIDLDRANKPRWKITGLQLPLDAQLLPGDQRVLVAEHDANQVTERDREGNVVWKKNVLGPLAAQRLPNGNTFIATRQQLLEVNPEGREVFRHGRPDGATFMKAQKLRNGDIACIVQMLPQATVRYLRLRPDGDDFKEAKSFDVNLRTTGGRIDVLPNGHVLLPEKDNNRLVELDEEGQVVWKATFVEPVAAVHVSGGTFLVTSFSQNRAAELTRSGKEVWEFREKSKVTRAFRR